MKKSGSFSLVMTMLFGFSGTLLKLETEVVTKQQEKKAPGCLDRWLELSMGLHNNREGLRLVLVKYIA